MTARLSLVSLLLGPISVMAEPAQPKSAPVAPRKVVRDCALSLWGCPNRPGTSDASQYDQIVQRARSQLQFGQTSPGADLSKSVTELLDATRLFPERSEAFVTLAMVYAEQGACDEGSTLMERILSSPPAGPVDLQWKERQTIQLGLALCQSRRGQYDVAAAQYRRMILTDGPTQRVLYRLGDVLMAQGLPEEAAQTYAQSCLELPALQPLVNVSRSCAGLLVALDRTHRQKPARVMTQLRRNDLGLRLLKMADFVPPAEQDYYQALLQPFGCEKETLLSNYLQAATPAIPRSYLRRAEEQLAENRAHLQGCPPPDPPRHYD